MRRQIYHSHPLVFPFPQGVSKPMNFYNVVDQLLIYVLCEAMGLFGLAHLFLTGSVSHFLNLMLVSMILMVLLYPRKIAEGN